MKFAVIDVETTGLNPATDRITEIGVVLIENFRITSTYQRLINPGIPVPVKITILTGINNQLLKTQSAFEELASEINEITGNHIIVGHHVNFDYSFLKNEMKRAGISFTRKTICTAEFGGILRPGRRSYSLASLCKLFAVTNNRPHRALPDAKATAEVFLHMAHEKGHDFIAAIFSSKAVSKLIPSHLRETVYKELPSTPGVYYFIGRNNKPVYIGKAGKLKSRVLSHFRGEGNSLKILAMASRIKNIRFTETGSELLASLLEDHEIRHYWPELNAAQKKYNVRFGIVYYKDQLNHWRMGITKGGKRHLFEFHFHQYHLATEFIWKRVEKFRLNSSLCGLPVDNKRNAEDHNANFNKMLEQEAKEKSVSVYFTCGRTNDEKGYVWIENGSYKGFGFVPANAPRTFDRLKENLHPRYTSITTENIINSLLEQPPELLLEIT